ncbi:hypothetical protein [Hoylesella shahii]|jgi:hypothetical protein|uniref:hypothetical protein n=1 Tax=Hoylesella shahii TaxID=228603 RepID=UPI00248DFE0A|nr:hypothetical protein [Hoylesella shahii]
MAVNTIVVKKQKSVKEMSVKELLLSPEFKTNLQKIVLELQGERKAKNGLVGQNLKRHPIDYLNLDVNYLIAEYAAILNKNSQLSSNSREFIKAVCEDAAIKTIKQLQDNETAREVRHGDN